MAGTYSFFPSDLDAPYSTRIGAHTLRLPASSPAKKRASSFNSDHVPEIADDTRPDPSYLEQSLGVSGAWGCCPRDIRDVRFCERADQYFTLSSADHNQKELAFPRSVQGGPVRTRPSQPNRSTLSIVEFEYQHALPQVTVSPWEKHPLHQSQASFSSVQTDATPSLTPSSSFSSNCSSPIHPDSSLQTSEYPPLPTPCTYSKPFEHSRLACSTPVSGPQPGLSNRPSTPAQDIEFRASMDTLTMPRADGRDLQSRRGKPLPSLPINPRHGSEVSCKRGANPGCRPSIEPSMISPPSLINPVTLEPHTTHFDRAMFIPANECPSPVPVLGPPSPTTANGFPVPSIKDRPSTSTSEAHCEQSVWESDSDTESLGPRPLSKKSMDTLKKVRSRVQLRVAKSAPKLQNSTLSQSNSHPLSRTPRMPDPPPEKLFPEPVKAAAQTSSTKQTLRLVTPSTTSFARPRTPRSPRNSNQEKEQPRNYDFDRSAAAAIQAKSRRRQQSDSPATSLPAEKEKVCTYCREERSGPAIHHTMTLSRPPFYKRVWESVRVLGCHGDVAPPKALPHRPT